MAEQHQNEIIEDEMVVGPSDPDPYTWVADEPRHTRSKYSGLAERPSYLFSTIEDPGRDNWEIMIPGRRSQVCQRFERWGGILDVPDSIRGAWLSVALQ
ncbi:hypothetical protein QL285_004379 [Trifolium repens]|nr:hypothetical protein QL285_004379 [Trifolium repens]